MVASREKLPADVLPSALEKNSHAIPSRNVMDQSGGTPPYHPPGIELSNFRDRSAIIWKIWLFLSRAGDHIMEFVHHD